MQCSTVNNTDPKFGPLLASTVGTSSFVVPDNNITYKSGLYDSSTNLFCIVGTDNKSQQVSQVCTTLDLIGSNINLACTNLQSADGYYCAASSTSAQDALNACQTQFQQQQQQQHSLLKNVCIKCVGPPN